MGDNLKSIRLRGMSNIGIKVLLDDDVFDVVKNKNLKYKESKDDENAYVYFEERKGGKLKRIKLHRWILHCTDENLFVDHKDGSVLNNQRENLRISTREENNRNRCSFANSSSQYKGTSKTKSGKWRAQIGIDGKVHLLGTFENEIEAAQNYDYHAKILFGEFARLNFPDFDYSQFEAKKKEL